MSSQKDITSSLDQSLKAYRVMNTPTKFSWKQHWAQEMFSHDDLLSCDGEERKRFEKRLLECPVTICNRITDSTGSICTLSDLVKTILNPTNKDIPKTHRHVIYSTANGERPIGKRAFEIWNGFQVIDMDIKSAELASSLKPVIFERLHKCNWFLGCVLSSSGKGLHIYTKIAIPKTDDPDPKKKRILYLTNFRHKYSFVYLATISACEKLGFTKDDVLKWMDLAMFKPQQGAFIGYDAHPLINSRFFEDFIYVNFDNIEDLGSPDIDWVTYPDLKEIFKRWEWFEDDNREEEVSIEVKSAEDLETDNHNRIHYKHFERWRLANTLVKIYGLDKGYKYLRMICTLDIKDKEIMADCVTASRHDKPVDEWAVNRLNTQHGFKIKLNVQDTGMSEDAIFQSMNKIESPNLIQESRYVKNFHITSNEYLGDIRYQILDACGRITLIEAGAGTGKTEMVKKLVAEGKKILMVMPFTSTIKSKVENDKNWYYSYGNRQPKLDSPARGLGMTIDKFSHLNLMDVKTAGFDYIFIDESHLMFQSEYRPVMSKVVEMIRNTELPIILMSGTPSGETVFFPDLVHIIVKKDDTRKKLFNVTLVDKPSDVMFLMCKAMARDVAEGRRVLFPTNSGTLYSKQIEAGVNYFLKQDFAIFEPVRLAYYKKSNNGEKFMDDVNFEKTIRDVQILLCSAYLSVGVDILDRFPFQIYFADLMLAQEIEQFANRLRSHDLLINMYVAKNDAQGNSRSLQVYKAMNFKLNEEEIKNVHSILRLCNEMIERNPVEYRYNSLIASIISDNKFIEYNEIDNKYYLNEISYKLINFERKYREYAEQLPVIMKGMMAYGYEITSKDLGGYSPEGSEVMADLKNFVKNAYDETLNMNTEYVEELLEMITEDRLGLYREVLQGKYDIRKGAEWKEDLSNRKMIVKSIEVFEKVVPICISLSKVYEMDKIREIFDFCRNKNMTFNFAAINRIRILTNIIYNDKNQRLDLPIKEFMAESYDFSDRGECTKTELGDFIRGFVQRYAMKASTKEIPIALASLTMQQMFDKFEGIFRCLVNVSRPGASGRIKMKRVELLWKWRDQFYHDSDNNVTDISKAYIIEDFLGVAKDSDSADESIDDQTDSNQTDKKESNGEGGDPIGSSSISGPEPSSPDDSFSDTKEESQSSVQLNE